MRLVIKIGGSLAFDENGPRFEYLGKIVPILRELAKNHQLIVAIGGGQFIRKYLRNVKGKLPDEQIEWLFIELLRANVRLLSFLVGLKPIFDLNEVTKETTGVVGGIKPGRSTDANAALCAEKIGASLFIKLTNVRGIFTKDPRKYKNAKLIKELPFKEVARVMKKKTAPAQYGILDPLALSVISRGKIRTIVTHGKNPKHLSEILEGKRYGTVIG